MIRNSTSNSENRVYSRPKRPELLWGPIQPYIQWAKVKGKVLHRTGHEDPEGYQNCNSTISLTSASDRVGG
jgi:hypothetical protein